MDKTLEQLKEQLKHYIEQEQYFNTMKLKAMGAIEVLEELTKEKVEEKNGNCTWNKAGRYSTYSI